MILYGIQFVGGNVVVIVVDKVITRVSDCVYVCVYECVQLY